MRILEIQFGQFAEVDPFNPRFVHGSSRLRIVLEMDGWESPHSPVALLTDRLVVLFPTLKEHKCNWEYLSMEGSSPEESTLQIGIQEFGGYEDIAHLVEHLVIDLQHSVAGMRLCSGVTCCYQDSRDRYDIFVESEDERTGRFAAFLAVEVMNRFLTEGEIDVEYRKVINLAKYLHRYSTFEIPREGLTHDAKRLLGFLVRSNFLPAETIY
jgi:hypothetical protein